MRALFRVRRSLRRAWMAWGPAGAFALVALLGAAVLQGLSADWREAAAVELTRIGELRASARQRLAAAQEDAATHSQRMSPVQWAASLPDGALRQDRLADLLEAAIKNGLSVERTEHALIIDATSGLERLRVAMPLAGPYPQLRAFIDTALGQDAALSLDALKLRRASATAATVEADLVWSLHGRRIESAEPTGPGTPGVKPSQQAGDTR